MKKKVLAVFLFAYSLTTTGFEIPYAPECKVNVGFEFARTFVVKLSCDF